MKRDYFCLDGRSSLEYGVWLTGEHTEDSPERDVESCPVPGRSGELILDKGRWKDTTLTYPCAIAGDFLSRFSAFKTFLLAKRGMRRLEDSFHPEEFRLVCLTGGITPSVTPHYGGGSFEVSLRCKPQRYLKSGEYPVRFTQSGGLLYNPTGYPALPLLKIFGTEGVLTIGQAVLTFTEIDEWVELDSDTQEAAKLLANKNSTVVAKDDLYPCLEAGENRISWTGGITAVEITPRWWRL